jgi:hypothetical protein
MDKFYLVLLFFFFIIFDIVSINIYESYLINENQTNQFYFILLLAMLFELSPGYIYTISISISISHSS